MSTYYIERKDLTGIAKVIVEKAYPEYNGNRFKIEVRDTFIPDQSWSGGSRTTWKLFKRIDGSMFNPGTSLSSGIFNPKEAFQSQEIPKGCLLVQHSIFCGKDMGITVVVRTDEFDTNLLPASKHNDLSRNELIVLIAIRSYISSARKKNALMETNITSAEYDAAITSLINKGLLRSNKSITTEGKNIVGSKNLYGL
jgi:hypothetical protein